MLTTPSTALAARAGGAADRSGSGTNRAAHAHGAWTRLSAAARSGFARRAATRSRRRAEMDDRRPGSRSAPCSPAFPPAGTRSRRGSRRRSSSSSRSSAARSTAARTARRRGRSRRPRSRWRRIALGVARARVRILRREVPHADGLFRTRRLVAALDRAVAARLRGIARPRPVRVAVGGRRALVTDLAPAPGARRRGDDEQQRQAENDDREPEHERGPFVP